MGKTKKKKKTIKKVSSFTVRRYHMAVTHRGWIFLWGLNIQCPTDMQSTSKGINKSLPISTQKRKRKTHWKNSFDRNKIKSRAFPTPLGFDDDHWEQCRDFSSGWPTSIFFFVKSMSHVFPINGPPIFSRYTSHASDPSPLADKIKSPEARHWWIFMPSDHQFFP